MIMSAWFPPSLLIQIPLDVFLFTVVVVTACIGGLVGKNNIPDDRDLVLERSMLIFFQGYS